MKVLAFNASPRKQQSTTDIILDYFLKGAERAGATTRKHYITELDIKGCIGCFACWTKTPGKCIHRDDMDKIIPDYIDADIIVFGTPIYNGNITHYLQKMTERLLPILLPWMEEKEGTTRHPQRHQRKQQKNVLAAVAGFPDHQAFNNVKNLFPNSLHILLPSSQILLDPEGRKLMKGFTDAVTESARQLVQKGTVDRAIKEKLIVKFSPEVKAMIREQANNFFEATMHREL